MEKIDTDLFLDPEIEDQNQRKSWGAVAGFLTTESATMTMPTCEPCPPDWDSECD